MTNRISKSRAAVSSKPASGLDRSLIAQAVEKAVESTPVHDIHTHLYDPAFGELLLWGIDDLLVYHYLVAEVFRSSAISFEQFWKRSKTEQADLIWNELFIQHSPVSEACRGILTTLQRLGLDVRKRDLPSIRKWFASRRVEDHITRCLELAGVRSVCMTNSPFDDLERPVWERRFARDERFMAGLRVDPLLLSWRETCRHLTQSGYKVRAELSRTTLDEVRRFLADWTKRIGAKYLMVSLPPEFAFPDKGPCAQLIEQAALPHCREFNLPFALMIGVKRAVNPSLQLAGDGVGLANLSALSALCAGFPENKFMATVLVRENQHELCVLARKFRNLHIFGCWWFMNIPSIIEEMTRMRVELLGLSFTPQHSDARVLDQLIYKWDHSRRIIGRVLADKYLDLTATGWEVTQSEIERDVKDLFGGAFQRFCQG
jgi:hypothetical protein